MEFKILIKVLFPIYKASWLTSAMYLSCNFVFSSQQRKCHFMVDFSALHEMIYLDIWNKYRTGSANAPQPKCGRGLHSQIASCWMYEINIVLTMPNNNMCSEITLSKLLHLPVSNELTALNPLIQPHQFTIKVQREAKELLLYHMENCHFPVYHAMLQSTGVAALCKN